MEQRKFFGIRLNAIYETIGFLLFMTFIAYVFGIEGNYRNVVPHPFWIIVLLMSVQYGAAEGLFAAALCTLFLYLGSFPLQNPTETAFDYQVRLIKLPFLWFLVAYVLGAIRNKLEKGKETLQAETEKAKEEARVIAEAYDVVKTSNENLAIHLVAQQKTFAGTYESFKNLSFLNPVEIIFGLDEIVQVILDPKKFSVYALGPNGLESATSRGWKESDTYLRRFTSSSPLYDLVVNHRRVVCVVNEDDAKALGEEGVLAGPLINPSTNEVFGMLKIEDMEFLDINLSTIEIFKILCKLIGHSYANAYQYQEMKKNSIFSAQPGIYSQAFFKTLKSYLVAQSKNFHFSLAQYKINANTSDLSKLTKIRELLHHSAPSEAFVCEGKKPGKEWLILWPSQKELNGMKEKLLEIEPSITIDCEHLHEV